MAQVLTPWDELTDEDARYNRWQLEHLEELGLGVKTATRLLEAGVSWHRVQDLVEAGCHPELAAAILL